MISAFLMGLLAVIATIGIISVAVISGKWLIEYVRKKLKNKKKHKVIFADTREVLDDYVRTKVKNSEEVSMDDLEKMCEEAPFVAAVVNEDGEINEYEGFRCSACNENFKARLKRQKGMIILEE